MPRLPQTRTGPGEATMARYEWSRARLRWIPVGETPVLRAPRLTLINRDKGFAAGVRSMADGRLYGARRAYDEHLRRHGMIEIGNETAAGARPLPSTSLPALRRGGDHSEGGSRT